MASAGAWGSPAAGGAPDDGAEWSFPDADEAVTAAGVTLRLPAAALDDLPSLAPVLSMRTWREALSESERDELRRLLPPGMREGPGQELEALLGGANVRFGNPVALAWSAMRQGLCHPRVARYEAALRLLRRAAHAHTVRQHHDGQVRRLQAARDAFAGAPALPLALRIAALSSKSSGGGGGGGGAQAPGAASAPAAEAAAPAAPKRKASTGPAPVLHDIDRLKKKQAAPVAPPAWVANAPPAVPWSAGGAAAQPLGKAVGKPPRAKRAEAAAALAATAALGSGLFATLRHAFCEPSGPQPGAGAPPLPARRMGVGALVASLRLRSERARGMNKKDAATAVEAALRFLAREGPPGPLVTQAGVTSAAEPTYVWAGPPWGAPTPWWRDELHGAPPAAAAVDEAAAAAAMEARFLAWLAAEAAGLDDITGAAAAALEAEPAVAAAAQ